MNRLVIFILALVAIAAPTLPAVAEVEQKAAQLIILHRYQSAAKILMASDIDAMDEQSLMFMGSVCLRNAQLHQEVAAAVTEVVPVYLRKLAAEKGNARSRYVDLFQGMWLLETGKDKAAQPLLEKFSVNKSIEAKYSLLARAYLGLAMYRQGNKTAAQKHWQAAAAGDPEVRAVLAGIYALTGQAETKVRATLADALATLKQEPLPPLALESALIVYAKYNDVRAALQQLRDDRALSVPVYSEQIAVDKQVQFFSGGLPRRLAEAYMQMAALYLQKAAQSGTVQGISEYYLAQTYVARGDLSKAAAVIERARSGGKLVAAFDNRAEILQSVLQVERNNNTGSDNALRGMAQRFVNSPELMAELVNSCTLLRLQCKAVIEIARQEAERSQNDRYRLLHTALGAYFRGQGDAAQALLYFETGRDKSMKNKMESNDPQMLVQMAQLHLQHKNFSENLEIYFELSKEYPVVRQIQDAVQAIYGMENQSAGDVKIF